MVHISCTTSQSHDLWLILATSLPNTKVKTYGIYQLHHFQYQSHNLRLKPTHFTLPKSDFNYGLHLTLPNTKVMTYSLYYHYLNPAYDLRYLQFNCITSQSPDSWLKLVTSLPNTKVMTYALYELHFFPKA